MKTRKTNGRVAHCFAFVLSTASLHGIGSSAWAADAVALNENSDNLQEIVVTARKREESVLSVPIAVTAVSGEEFSRRGFDSVNDLVQAVPGVQVASFEGKEQVNVTIRGIGMANQFSSNAATPAGLYADEVYQTFSPSTGLQMFDLQRVEVLRGPQGTLFGHNTTAGSIDFESIKPALNGSPNGYATVGGGNFGRALVEGASDVTLIEDKLGFRVAAQFERATGYINNLGGEAGGAENNLHARIIFRAKPDDEWDILFKAYAGRDHGTNPRVSIGHLPPNLCNSAGYCFGSYSSPWTINTPVPIPLTTDQAGAVLNAKWSRNAYTVTSITAYEHGSNFSHIDCDGSPADLCQTYYTVYGDQASEDLRLNYDTDKAHGVAGVFYGWDYLNFRQPTHFDDGALFNIDDHYQQKRSTEAAYAEMAFDVTSAWTVTLGSRYTFDQDTLYNVYTTFDDSFAGTPLTTTIPGPVGSPFVPGEVLPARHGNTDGFTGRAIVSYKFDNNILAYASFSHGYRAGNFNGSEFFSSAEANFVAPEKINTPELGLKGKFLDNRLSFAAALFYNSLHDQQVATQIITAGDVFTPGLGSLNGHSEGVELETAFQVTPAFRVTGNVSRLRSRYDDNQVINATIPVGGKSFPFAPDWTGFLEFDWRMWHWNNQSLTLTGSANYMGRFYYDPQNGFGATGIYFKNGSAPYTLVDSRLTYQMERISVAAWGRNLTNKFYLPFNANGGDFDAATAAQPRTYGIDFRVSF